MNLHDNTFGLDLPGDSSDPGFTTKAFRRDLNSNLCVDKTGLIEEKKVNAVVDTTAKYIFV